jgi:AcrR family transcriptional regulator
MNTTSLSGLVNGTSSDPDGKLRHVPTQARSRERLRRVLDAAEELLTRQGASAFTTARIAESAGVPIGSVYHYFSDKGAIVEALALRYWSDFEDLVAAAAETDEGNPLPDPAGAVLDALGRRVPRPPRLPGLVVLS